MIPAITGGALAVGLAKVLIDKALSDRTTRDRAQTSKEQKEKAGAGRGKQGESNDTDEKPKLAKGGYVNCGASVAPAQKAKK